MVSRSGVVGLSSISSLATKGDTLRDIPEDDCNVEALRLCDSTSPGHAAKSGVSEELGIVSVPQSQVQLRLITCGREGKYYPPRLSYVIMYFAVQYLSQNSVANLRLGNYWYYRCQLFLQHVD